MAALTWREVSAPNFSTSLDGYRVAGNALDRGFSGMADALGKFNGYNQDLATSALLNNASKYTDEPSLRGAIADGSVFNGVNPTYLTPDSYKALDSHASDLLANATSQQNINYHTGADPLTIQSKLLDNAHQGITNQGAAQDVTQTGIINAHSNLAYNADHAGLALYEEAFHNTPGDTKSVQDYIDRNGTSTPEIKAAAQKYAISGGGGGTTAGGYGGGGGGQSRAPGAGVDTGGGAGGGENGATNAITGAVNSPGAGGIVSLGTDPKGNPYATPTPMNGMPGTSAFLSTVPKESADYISKIMGNTGDLGGLSTADKVDKIMPYLIDAESGGNPNAVSPKGAQGLTQIMPATGADPGFGIKPLQDNSTAERVRFSRDYLGKMIDRYGGNADLALLAYNAGPGTADKAAQLHPALLQSESQNLNSQAAKALSEATGAIGQGNASGSGEFAETQRSNRNPAQVYAEVKGGVPDPNAPKNGPGAGGKLLGPFSDIDPNGIQSGLKAVNDAAAAANSGKGVTITPDTAAALLNKHGTAIKGSTIGKYFTGINPEFGQDSISIDNAGLNADIAKIGSSTGTEAQNQGNQVTAAIASSVQQAQQAYNSKLSHLLDMETLAKNRPDAVKGGAIAQALADKNQAAQMLKFWMGKQQGSPNMKPQFTDTPAGAGAANGISIPPDATKPTPQAISMLKAAMSSSAPQKAAVSPDEWPIGMF